MEYRRFGKTEKKISVITLGTMRFKNGWDQPKEIIPAETLSHTVDVLNMAFDAGINHIETAAGYVKSEKALGMALNDELGVSRDRYHLMTKSNASSAEEIRKTVEKQLKTLKSTYFDFYAWHGINNMEILENATTTGGPVEELLKMKEEGLIRHVGFSTHAPLDVIVRTINTDLFEFINLHYYYFMQRNLDAVRLAGEKDMGVFIISPNDKGGQLFKASNKVKKAISHASPIQWNARFCLSHPEIHTLSFGMTAKDHFREMAGIFPSNIPMLKEDEEVKGVLDAMVNDDPFAWYEGYELGENADTVNVPAVLRLRKLWKCYDMIDYAQYRYKVLEQKSHWFPGVMATDSNIEQTNLDAVPSVIPVKKLLKETHEALRPDKIKSVIND